MLSILMQLFKISESFLCKPLTTDVVHVHYEIGIKVKCPFPLNTSNHTNQVLKPNHQVKDGAMLSIHFPRPKLQLIYTLLASCINIQHSHYSQLIYTLLASCINIQHSHYSQLIYTLLASCISIQHSHYSQLIYTLLASCINIQHSHYSHITIDFQNCHFLPKNIYSRTGLEESDSFIMETSESIHSHRGYFHIRHHLNLRNVTTQL